MDVDVVENGCGTGHFHPQWPAQTVGQATVGPWWRISTTPRTNGPSEPRTTRSNPRVDDLRAHYLRDLLGFTPKSSQPWVATLVRTIFDQADATEVEAQFDRVVEALSQKLPRAAEHLDTAKSELLAFTTNPREIWRQISSSNPQERLNKEIRRRTDVVGIFPNRDAIIRLVGAVLAEQHDEWTEGRRYFGLDLLTKVDTARKPHDTTEINVTPEALTA